MACKYVNPHTRPVFDLLLTKKSTDPDKVHLILNDPQGAQVVINAQQDIANLDRWVATHNVGALSGTWKGRWNVFAPGVATPVQAATIEFKVRAINVASPLEEP